jgi:hypothetical protein
MGKKQKNKMANDKDILPIFHMMAQIPTLSSGHSMSLILWGLFLQFCYGFGIVSIQLMQERNQSGSEMDSKFSQKQK